MTKLQRRATITREHLLDAALEIIQTQGINGFTLDRVAESAGVSKGGLLYHFPNRDSLVEGLLRRSAENFERLYKAYLEAEPPGNGRQLRAYIQASLDDSLASLELLTLLRAATAENPNLVALIQREFIQWRRRLFNDGIPKTWMRIIRRATDAYWNDHLLGVIEDSSTERHAFRDELLRLTYQKFDVDVPAL